MIRPGQSTHDLASDARRSLRRGRTTAGQSTIRRERADCGGEPRVPKDRGSAIFCALDRALHETGVRTLIDLAVGEVEPGAFVLEPDRIALGAALIDVRE
jgi:hypothetical protein